MADTVACPCCRAYEQSPETGDARYRSRASLHYEDLEGSKLAAAQMEGRCRLCGHDSRYGLRGLVLPEVATAWRLGGMKAARAVEGWEWRYA